MRGFFKFGNPVIELAIESGKVEALLDTGFNGHVMLPSAVIEELGTDADFSLAGMELFHDCKIVIERNKDIVEVSKSKC